jgi:hypothetical protein
MKSENTVYNKEYVLNEHIFSTVISNKTKIMDYLFFASILCFASILWVV